MRVALVTGPDPGHTLPIVGLAARLRRAGHHPMVVTGARWAPLLAGAGLEFAELPLLAAATTDEDAGTRLAERPVAMARPLAARLSRWGPDVVVADTLTRAGGLAAALLGLSWVEFVPHMLADPSRALPPFGTGWRPNRLRDPLLRRLADRSRAAGLAQRARACRAAGLADPPPVHRLVATLPGLEPPRPDWPARTTVIGPVAFEPATVDLAVPPGDAPLVLVVSSTATGTAADLLGLAVGRLRGVRLAAPAFAVPDRRLPGWAVSGPGRLGPLLARSALVLSPAGHGMVAAALDAGVPLVMVPGAGDQKEVAARVARAGAGLVATPATVGRQVRRVLRDPEFAAAAARLGRAGRSGLPAPEAVLEAALGARG